MLGKCQVRHWKPKLERFQAVICFANNSFKNNQITINEIYISQATEKFKRVVEVKLKAQVCIIVHIVNLTPGPHYSGSPCIYLYISECTWIQVGSKEKGLTPELQSIECKLVFTLSIFIHLFYFMHTCLQSTPFNQGIGGRH